MESDTIVQGLSGLAALIGIETLVPSVVVISRLLRAIAERNAKLDAAATIALRDLIASTGEIMGDFDRVLRQSLENAFVGLHERHHLALFEVLHQIDNLNGLEPSGRAQVMHEAVRASADARKSEVAAHGAVKKILALAGGSALVVLAASIGYKYARPKTFWEIIFRS